MDLLELSRSSVDDWTVVSAVGEVDVASSPALLHAIDDAMARSSRVIINLSGVSFLDSTGLGVLVRAHNASKDSGGDLRVVVSDPNVLKVFEVTALDEVFDLRGSVAIATD